MARVLIIVAIVAASVTGIWYATRPTPIPVRLHTVDRGPVAATVSNTRVGTVKACTRALLAPAIGGEVATLAVREGASVKAGDVLMEVWNKDLQAQVKLARAEVASARSRVDEVCFAAAGARREADRLNRLLANKLVAEERVDTAATEADVRTAACAATRAAQDVAEARLEVAESTLLKTRVTAPFAGQVAEVNVEIGEFVTPSPLGIATLPAIDLIDVSCLYVSAPIDEVDAPAIKLGMPACVTLDAFADRRCSGTVRRIAPYVLELEKQARTVEVEVELRQADDLRDLLPGYSADIEVMLASHEDAIRVPTEAVLEGDRVYVFDAATSHIALRKVTAGLHNWDYTEIVDGLGAGDRIVLSVGKEGIEDGAYVVAEEPPDETP